jgi:hypothetical protein
VLRYIFFDEKEFGIAGKTTILRSMQHLKDQLLQDLPVGQVGGIYSFALQVRMS